LFLLAGSLLRSLQRIDRARTRESTALTRRSLGLRDQHISFARTRYRTLDHDQDLFKVDAANTQVATRHTIHAHMTRHALPRKNTRGEWRCTDRALHLKHVSMRLGTATEIMA